GGAPQDPGTPGGGGRQGSPRRRSPSRREAIADQSPRHHEVIWYDRGMADRTARLRALVDRLGDVANRDVAATIKLAALGSALVSRSEARRLVDRLPEFTD